MPNKFLVILSFFLLFSCNPKEEKPEDIWSEERMVEVLTEVQLTEAIVRLGYNRLSDTMYHNDTLYSSVFRLLGTNQDEFDKNLDYYVKHPQQLEDVYDQVITNLSTRTSELKASRKELKESPAIEE